MFDKLDFTVDKYEELAKKVSDPDIISDKPTWQKYMKEMGEMEPIVKEIQALQGYEAGAGGFQGNLRDGR